MSIGAEFEPWRHVPAIPLLTGNDRYLIGQMKKLFSSSFDLLHATTDRMESALG
jgi:hypothetical protein